MQLSKKVYDDKSKIYYYDQLEQRLIKKISKCLKHDIQPNNSNLELIKKDKGRQVFRLEHEGKGYYLKKYCYRKLSKKIKNLFRRTEALRALKISKNLLTAGISVVKPVLAVTYRYNLWTWDSVFVTEEFSGQTLQQYLAYGDYDFELKERVIKRVARLWAEFYKEGFLNGDPNLTSILVKFEQDDFKIVLVDVDNIRHYPFLPWKSIVKNLVNFNAHTYSGLDKMGGQRLSCEDRLVFLKELIKEYNQEVEIREVADYIFSKTVDRLIKWNKKELVKTIVNN